MKRALSSLGLLLLLQCTRSESSHAGSSAPEPDRAAQPATARQTAQRAPKFVRAAVPRVVAIGDLHGDLTATRRALRLAGAIDEADHWSGGTLTVVQTGDVIDRGDDDRAVLDLLERLRDEARAAGGELVWLQGNHELMNVARDFRYVSPASAQSFANEGGRTAAFSPGGHYARLLAPHPLVAQVGSTLFVHGGILSKHVRYGLDRMSEEVSAWMRGELPLPPEIAVDADGLIWTRRYSSAPEDCDQLRSVLAQLGAARMVVGHTVQPEGITSACDGRVFRIDVGLSAAYGGPTQVLEIRGDALRILRVDP